LVQDRGEFLDEKILRVAVSAPPCVLVLELSLRFLKEYELHDERDTARDIPKRPFLGRLQSRPAPYPAKRAAPRVLLRSIHRR
jgi:hypothetical protein